MVSRTPWRHSQVVGESSGYDSRQCFPRRPSCRDLQYHTKQQHVDDGELLAGMDRMRGRAESYRISKLELGFELDHARTGILPAGASQDTSGRLFRIGNESETWIGDIPKRETEIGMVERVEKLKPYGKGDVLP